MQGDQQRDCKMAKSAVHTENYLSDRTGVGQTLPAFRDSLPAPAGQPYLLEPAHNLHDFS